MTVLLDACVLINLLATQRFPQIAESLRMRFAIVEQVSDEAFYLRSTADAGDHDRVSLQGLLDRKLLEIVVLDPSELGTFVQLASTLDDGEAATITAGLHRGIPLATDDRAALRFLATEHPEVPVMSTSVIVQAFSRAARLGTQELADCLQQIEDQANYLPRRQDPQHDWWRQAIGR